jgi:hypothetical protein
MGESGVYLNDVDVERLRGAARADELCGGGRDLDGDTILVVGLPVDNVHCILLALRPPSSCSCPTCRDGSWRDDGGCNLGAPRSQAGRCDAARCKKGLLSDQTLHSVPNKKRNELTNC